MRIISCYEAVRRIFELLEGELKVSKREELDNHLGTCRECCNRYEFEKLLKEKLQEISLTKMPPKKLLNRIDRMLKNF